MSVVISEFGVPAARGITHLAKDPGFHQRGLTKEQQGKAIVSMLEDILDTNGVGACVFICPDSFDAKPPNASCGGYIDNYLVKR